MYTHQFTFNISKLTKSLLTYRKHILDMYKQEYDCAAYDRHFLFDRETNRCSWSSIRHDLLLQYSLVKQNNFQPRYHSTNKSSIKTSDGNFIPGGFLSTSIPTMLDVRNAPIFHTSINAQEVQHAIPFTVHGILPTPSQLPQILPLPY